MPESLLPCAARSSTTIGDPSQVSLEASPCKHCQDWVTINTLPDDALVEIFDFYVNHSKTETNGWHKLVHVCQRWRHVVFASPRRLNLQLMYKGKRPISEILDVWPVLPVVISQRHASRNFCWRNVAGALESEHRDRICAIHLSHIPSPHWERLAAAMQKPFPELTHLSVQPEGDTATSLPDSLDGSAPLLQELKLNNCPFQGLPKLLLSAGNHLVCLSLWNVPDSGYISPQDLGTALSVLSRLEFLHLGFQSPLYPASRPPPPLTHTVLPVLTFLAFRGVHEYLEDVLAQVEAPLLNKYYVSFSMNPDFVLPQLHRLISHAKSFQTCDRGAVVTSVDAIQFIIYRGTNLVLALEIRCTEWDRQLASLAQVCRSTFPHLSLVRLGIADDVPQVHWNNARWLELLDPFTAVKDLRLSYQVAKRVCPELEQVTHVLPALQNIILYDLSSMESVPKCIMTFVAARELSGHPVAVQLGYAHWT